MREIKFRGKALSDDHKWLYGNLNVSDDGKAAIMRIGDFWSLQRVDPDTVGQFTGLTDDNRKEIYEGDIVRVKDEDELDTEASLGVVKYYAATDYYSAFDIEFAKPNQDGRYIDCNALSHFVINCGIEVIGNIYDNPELLNND